MSGCIGLVVCVGASHLVNFVPPPLSQWHLPCAHNPVGTAFIQHDRTSLLFFAPLFSLLPQSPDWSVLLSLHPLRFCPSYFCSLLSFSPHLCFPVCSRAGQCDAGSRAAPHLEIVLGWSQRRGERNGWGVYKWEKMNRWGHYSVRRQQIWYLMIMKVFININSKMFLLSIHNMYKTSWRIKIWFLLPQHECSVI